jgi:hypothetical protein
LNNSAVVGPTVAPSQLNVCEPTKNSSVPSTVARAKKNRSKSSGRGKPLAAASNQSGRSRTKSRSTRTPAIPAALSAHVGWSVVDVPATTDIQLSDQKTYLDYTLTGRIVGFMDGVWQRLQDKLDAIRLEASPKNIFILLAQPGIDKILEYTVESMNRSGVPPLCPTEFNRFIGTSLCSSCFTLALDDSFELMNSLSNGGVMKHKRFKEILHHLKGVDCGNENNPAFSHSWDDQRNLLRNIHPFGTRIFERPIYYLFDSINGAYVYNDELIASKAKDVELRTLSDRKTGGEGPTVDCLCNSFFQYIISMRLRTLEDSQLENCIKVL